MQKDEALREAIETLQELAARCDAELRLRGRSPAVRVALQTKAQRAVDAAAVLTGMLEG